MVCACEDLREVQLSRRCSDCCIELPRYSTQSMLGTQSLIVHSYVPLFSCCIRPEFPKAVCRPNGRVKSTTRSFHSMMYREIGLGVDRLRYATIIIPYRFEIQTQLTPTSPAKEVGKLLSRTLEHCGRRAGDVRCWLTLRRNPVFQYLGRRTEQSINHRGPKRCTRDHSHELIRRRG